MSKKLNYKVKNEIDEICIKFQNKILDRLKLYDFSKNAIDYYCVQKTKNSESYEFREFKNKFLLSKFREEKEISNINSKELKNFGKEFVENELGNSIFVLNMSTFEHWYLSLLQYRMYHDPTILIRKKKNNDEIKKVDLDWILTSTNLDELLERIINDQIKKYPYSGLRTAISRFLGLYDLRVSNFSENILDNIHEKHLLRNCIVHNKSIINETYLKESKSFKRYKLNDVIIISEKILFEQGDILLAFIQEFRRNLNK